MSTAQGSAPQGCRPQSTSTSEGPLGTFEILNVPSRVMTPPRLLPLDKFRLEAPELLIDEVFGNEFVEKASEVASRLNMGKSITWVEITSRVSRYNPLDSLPTLLIVMDNWEETSPGPWQDLVQEMKKHIDGRIANTPAASSLNISVEVICKDLVREKYLSPLDDDEMYPQILAAWPEIKARIRHILESSPATVDCITCIALFKLGFDGFFNNPKTVYISLSHDSAETGWPPPVLAEIRSLLDGYGFNLHAHMEHNSPTPLADFPLLLSTKPATKAEVKEKIDQFNMILPPHLDTKVNAGADIGACTYVSKIKSPPSGAPEEGNPLVGTLGCWLEIKVQDRGWRTVGLTNYHVVRPCLSGFQIVDDSKGLHSGPVEKDKPLWKADREGLRAPGRKQRAQVESPTRSKLNFSVKLNRDEKEKVRLGQGELGQGSTAYTARIAEMEAQEKEWRVFFDNQKHVLGSVCFASGYLERTSQNGRLDWALIDPSENGRVGQNLLPTMEEWRNGSYWWESPCCLGGKITSPRQGTRSIHQMKKDDLVYKVGAATKCTVGKFDALKVDCDIREERYMEQPKKLSTEFMFIGEGELPFARKGDSGSIVWDTHGRAVGLLFRGQCPGQSRGCFAFVTPIEDVFTSIKAKSGGKIEEIRFLGESLGGRVIG